MSEGPDDVIGLASKLGASADARSCDGGTNGGGDGTSEVLSRLELVLKSPGVSGVMAPYFVVQRLLLAKIVVLIMSYPWLVKDTTFAVTVERSDDQMWRVGRVSDVDRRWTTPDLTGEACPGRISTSDSNGFIVLGVYACRRRSQRR